MEYQRYQLRDIGDIVSGATPKTTVAENFGGAIPWLTPADLSGYTQKYISRGKRNLTQLGYSVSHNDLIICEGGEPGRCAVWDKQDSIFYQKALHRVRFLDNSNPRFYMYYLWFSAQSGQLCRYFTGTGIKHLTGQSLSRVIVPTADRTIQDSIVAEIESRLSVCDSIENTVDTALQQAEALRQSILKKAFEGGLM